MRLTDKEVVQMLCSKCMCKRSLNFRVEVKEIEASKTEAGQRLSLSVSGIVFGCKTLSRRVLFRLEMLLESMGIHFRLDDHGWSDEAKGRSAILVLP